MSEDLAARIDRLESLDAIRQLPAKYALALDMRDMDAMVGLFPADVRVGKETSGREALRRYLDETMRVQFNGTSHHIGGHIIEFDDPDHARGIVYSKNEHETGPEWVIMQMMYVDDYERIDGRWYFRRRLPLYWYATERCAGPGASSMRGASTNTSRRGATSGRAAGRPRGRCPSRRRSISSSPACAAPPTRRASGCAER